MITKKTKRCDERIKREIEKSIAHFSEHLMSNSKWVRLIKAIIDNLETIKKIEYKNVQNDKICELFLDKRDSYGSDYYATGLYEGSAHITYREIEYLIFPKTVDKNVLKEQNLNDVIELLNRIGQFSLDVNEERIKLECYR
ncbi:hypothetical protein [Nonlabens xiamenensis]|uniref:hypothetical protein n=1 Tax=Nonlabens xiamenensis TaxID=2341043 RepID=UPI000F614920|nr:hypothetical protein [Nonlabens xiamenensis]